MEPVFLFAVEDRFTISGRGCVLVPGIPPELQHPVVHVGDSIRLVTPTGNIIDTTVHGVEMISYRGRPPERITVPISIPRSIAAIDVPVGTQVFYTGARREP